MKWNEFKELIDEIITKEQVEDPEISCIDISAGSMQINPELIIHLEDGGLDIY